MKLLYVTAANEEEATKISQTLVEEKLAACTNILGSISSVYRWQGAIETGSEVAMLVKTSTDKASKVIDRIADIHSYETPCILTIPVDGGFGPFLDWVSEQTAT